MKSIVLASLLCVGYLSAFEISMTKEFVKEIKPNRLGISLTFVTNGKTLKDVIDKLSEYSAFVKSFRELDIRGGRFSTSPEYRYENHKRYKIGYRGRMSFTVKSDDEKKLENFISMISSKDSENVDIQISTAQWKVDESSITKEQDSLKFEALSWAEEYSKILSDKTGKSCDIKSVDFQDRGYRPPIVYEARAAVAKDAPMPQKRAQKITIDARFKFECK